MASFALSKPKYASLNVLPKLNIPAEFNGWTSKDISQQLNTQEKQYNFVNNVFARVYTNPQGQEILLLVLDAGNFHNPKTCYGTSGFTTTELTDTNFQIPTKQFNTTTLYLTKSDTHLVLIYWLCINKKLIGWSGQKVQEFFYTLSNKKKAGLMVRLDIPSSPDNKKSAIQLAQSFIADLSKSVSPQDLEYLFGK